MIGYLYLWAKEKVRYLWAKEKKVKVIHFGNPRRRITKVGRTAYQRASITSRHLLA